MDGILALEDEFGNEVLFEYFDAIEYENREFVILFPLDSNDGEIMILEVKVCAEDPEKEKYIPVEPRETLLSVYAIFKERYKDVLEFVD